MGDGTTRFESTPAESIPDNKPTGIEDAIEVTAAQTIQNLSIEVDITHTWIGDLNLVLVGPEGDEVALHSRTGRNADDIQATYTLANTPALSVLRGKQAMGTWRIRVSDNASRDTGKLNKWAIVLT